MSGLYLDTHTLIWYLSDPKNLSANALVVIDQAVQDGMSLYVSAITIIEIIYLVEKGRIPEAALDLLLETADDPATCLRIDSIDLNVALAVRQVPRDAVPDMPDRLIAASAMHRNVPLVTRDTQIRNSSINTIW